MEESKKKLGGRREGAGRPKGVTQKPVLLKLDIELMERLATVSNRNRFINQAVREKIERESAPEAGEEKPEG